MVSEFIAKTDHLNMSPIVLILVLVEDGLREVIRLVSKFEDKKS